MAEEDKKERESKEYVAQQLISDGVAVGDAPGNEEEKEEDELTPEQKAAARQERINRHLDPNSAARKPWEVEGEKWTGGFDSEGNPTYVADSTLREAGYDPNEFRGQHGIGPGVYGELYGSGGGGFEFPEPEQPRRPGPEQGGVIAGAVIDPLAEGRRADSLAASPEFGSGPETIFGDAATGPAGAKVEILPGGRHFEILVGDSPTIKQDTAAVHAVPPKDVVAFGTPAAELPAGFTVAALTKDNPRGPVSTLAESFGVPPGTPVADFLDSFTRVGRREELFARSIMRAAQNPETFWQMAGRVDGFAPLNDEPTRINMVRNYLGLVQMVPGRDRDPHPNIVPEPTGQDILLGGLFAGGVSWVASKPAGAAAIGAVEDALGIDLRRQQPDPKSGLFAGGGVHLAPTAEAQLGLRPGDEAYFGGKRWAEHASNPKNLGEIPAELLLAGATTAATMGAGLVLAPLGRAGAIASKALGVVPVRAGTTVIEQAGDVKSVWRGFGSAGGNKWLGIKDGRIVVGEPDPIPASQFAPVEGRHSGKDSLGGLFQGGTAKAQAEELARGGLIPDRDLVRYEAQQDLLRLMQDPIFEGVKPVDAKTSILVKPGFDPVLVKASLTGNKNLVAHGSIEVQSMANPMAVGRAGRASGDADFVPSRTAVDDLLHRAAADVADIRALDQADSFMRQGIGVSISGKDPAMAARLEARGYDLFKDADGTWTATGIPKGDLDLDRTVSLTGLGKGETNRQFVGSGTPGYGDKVYWEAGPRSGGDGKPLTHVGGVKLPDGSTTATITPVAKPEGGVADNLGAMVGGIGKEGAQVEVVDIRRQLGELISQGQRVGVVSKQPTELFKDSVGEIRIGPSAGRGKDYGSIAIIGDRLESIALDAGKPELAANISLAVKTIKHTTPELFGGGRAGTPTGPGAAGAVFADDGLGTVSSFIGPPPPARGGVPDVLGAGATPSVLQSAAKGANPSALSGSGLPGSGLGGSGSGLAGSGLGADLSAAGPLPSWLRGGSKPAGPAAAPSWLGTATGSGLKHSGFGKSKLAGTPAGSLLGGGDSKLAGADSVLVPGTGPRGGSDLPGTGGGKGGGGSGRTIFGDRYTGGGDSGGGGGGGSKLITDTTSTITTDSKITTGDPTYDITITKPPGRVLVPGRPWWPEPAARKKTKGTAKKQRFLGNTFDEDFRGFAAAPDIRPYTARASRALATRNPIGKAAAKKKRTPQGYAAPLWAGQRGTLRKRSGDAPYTDVLYKTRQKWSKPTKAEKRKVAGTGVSVW